MKSPWRVILAVIVAVSLLPAQSPTVQITNVTSGTTLVVTNAGGISQLDVSTFRFYLTGVDMTAAFIAFVQSGTPVVSISVTSTSITIVIGIDLTVFTFAARVCTFAGLCGTHNVVFEGFHTANQRDTTFAQTFGSQQARWNDPSAPSQLAGRALSGSPTGPLGTRVQIVVDPLPNTTNPSGLFSPFDASAANSGGQCGANGCNLGPPINPGGGSHIMHLYESADLGNTRDSLELVEWSPVNGVTAATTYPNYKIWCGLTNYAAPISGGVQQGMTSVFDSNYTLVPYQAGIAIAPPCAYPTVPNARKVPCGGPMPYVVPLMTTQFVPFPILSPCFDFGTSGGTFGPGVNLLVEQDIDQGSQVPNFNRYRATSFQPRRRLIDKPIALMPPGVCPFDNGGLFEVYRMRFTFVGLVSQVRSLWYDTGITGPNYLSFILTPPLSAQPAGTQSTWILEGSNTSNPGPGTIGTAGVYINAAGVTFQSVLTTTIAQNRYFRFRIEFRGDNVANGVPAYDDVSMVYY